MTETKRHRRTALTSITPAQREQLRTALERKRQELLRACGEREEQVADAEAEAGDVADVAEGVIEDRERAALDGHDRALLAEIEHALARFDGGSYGLSENSGRPIRFERLLAVPWARYDSDEAELVEHGLRG